MIELPAINDIFYWMTSFIVKCVNVLLLQLAYPSCRVFAFCIIPLCNDHLCLVGAELKPDGDASSWAEVEELARSATVVRPLLFYFEVLGVV